MKIKLMPLLAGVITLSAVATPFILKAQAETPNQPAPTQRTHQRQGKWDKLNLSDQQKEQMRQIHRDVRSQIEAVLTPQQLEQLKTARQKSQAGQAPQGRRSVMAVLSLSDEQRAKIKGIKQAQKRRFEAVLTANQKQQLEQMRQQRKQQRQQQQPQPNNQ